MPTAFERKMLAEFERSWDVEVRDATLQAAVKQHGVPPDSLAWLEPVLKSAALEIVKSHAEGYRDGVQMAVQVCQQLIGMVESPGEKEVLTIVAEQLARVAHEENSDHAM
jgi:hypothetical protein